jgi:methyl-accepting chemotaxis protein
MASVLETFLILFESNADDVDKGSQQAKKSTDSLNDALKNTQAATDKTAESFTKMLASAGGALASVLSVAAITGAVMAAADNADMLGEFTERLGLNIEEVNAWGDAVKVNGGTAEGFRGSLESLIDGMVTFATKGTSRVAPFFKELGIDMVDANGKARDVMEILPELADAFEGLGRQESAGLGRKLGLDQGTIMLLQRGRREVDDQIRKQKELGTVTKENAEIAGKFNDQYDNTGKVFRSLFTIMGSTILPLFTRVLSGIESIGMFLAKHSDFVVGLMIALGAAITIYALPPLISMAIAVVTAFAPFLLMGALIAGIAIAFALLYDDIMNFIDGNDSLIGQILTAYPAIGVVVSQLVEVVKSLWDAVSWVFESIWSVLQISIEGWRLLFGLIGDGVQSFVQGSSIMQSIIGAITSAFTVAGDIIGAIWDGVGNRITAVVEIIRKAIGWVKMAAGVISSVLGDKKASLGISEGKSAQSPPGVAEGKAAIAKAGSSAISSQTSNSIANSSRTANKTTSVQTGPITVHTQATDAEGVAGAIGSSLGQQMRQASANFDDGVQA